MSDLLIKNLDEGLKKLQVELKGLTEESKKEYDGLLETTRKNLAEEITKKGELIQALEQKAQVFEEKSKAQEEQIIKLESAFAKTSFNGEQKAFDDEVELKKLRDFIVAGDNRSIEIKTVRTDDGPSAGFLFLPNYSNVIHSTQTEYNPIRSLATVISSNSTQEIDTLDDEDNIDDLGAKPNKGTELSAFVDTDMLQYGILSWTASNEINVKPSISTKALQFNSTRNLEADLQNKISIAIAKKEGVQFLTGSGAGEAKGILSYAAWSSAGAYERGKLEVRNSGTSGAGLTRDVLLRLTGDLKEFYHANATFVMNRKTWVEVLLDKSTNQYHNMPTEGTVRNIQGLSMLGYPVRLAPNMPIPAANSLSISFGDFRLGYKIVDFGGLLILRDPYSVDKKVVFKVTKYTDAKVANFEAIKLLKLAA